MYLIAVPHKHPCSYKSLLKETSIALRTIELVADIAHICLELNCSDMIQFYF